MANIKEEDIWAAAEGIRKFWHGVTHPKPDSKQRLTKKEERKMQNALNDLNEKSIYLLSLGKKTFLKIQEEDFKNLIGFNFIIPDEGSLPANIGMLASESDEFTFLTRIDMNSSKSLQQYEERAFGKILSILNYPSRKVFFDIGITVKRDHDQTVSGSFFWDKGYPGGKEIDPMNPAFLEPNDVFAAFSSIYKTVSQPVTAVEMISQNGNKLVVSKPIPIA